MDNRYAVATGRAKARGVFTFHTHDTASSMQSSNSTTNELETYNAERMTHAQ